MEPRAFGAPPLPLSNIAILDAGWLAEYTCSYRWPWGVPVADRGRIYITDTLPFRLQIYQKQEGYENPQFNL